MGTLETTEQNELTEKFADLLPNKKKILLLSGKRKNTNILAYREEVRLSHTRSISYQMTHGVSFVEQDEWMQNEL